MAKADYRKYLVDIRGRQYLPMTLSNRLVAGCNLYIKLGWIYGMPEPNPHILEHSHDYDEIVLHIGGDPQNPEELGAGLEFCIGGQPLAFDTTTAVYAPRGINHGPLTWKRVDRPHLLMPIIIGASTLEEAAPAGYSGK